ncbi:PH domain-containing protein [Micromonospora sp. PLK6-60]|nr:PH domain-containing protein [Micromonospora sp. PLK6-60]
MHAGQAALAPPDRGTHRSDDDRVTHLYSPVTSAACDPTSSGRESAGPLLTPAVEAGPPVNTPGTRERPAAADRAGWHAGAVTDQSSEVRQWRVPAVLPVAKLAGAVLVIGLGLLFAGGDRVQLVLAVTAGVVLAGWGVRDLVAPVRVAVDPEGITLIRGFAGRQRLPWTAVEAITVDRRSRAGLATEILEIDTGESLHLFGRYDLDAAPTDVAAALRAARRLSR